MSEKKYDVYSGNEKIGEVWGKSAEEEASDMLSAINQQIDREERRSLRQSDRISAMYGNIDAIEREAVRANADKAFGKEMRWKTIFIISIIASVLGTLSGIGLGFGIPADQESGTYLLEYYCVHLY